MTKNNKQPIAAAVRFNKNHPMWNEIPKIGIEGLIATAENEEELMQKAD